MDAADTENAILAATLAATLTNTMTTASVEIDHNGDKEDVRLRVIVSTNDRIRSNETDSISLQNGNERQGGMQGLMGQTHKISACLARPGPRRTSGEAAGFRATGQVRWSHMAGAGCWESRLSYGWEVCPCG